MNRLPLLLLVFVGLAAGLFVARSQAPALGPADGLDLAPLDTGRVSIGDVAPDFTLNSRSGDRTTLSDLRGRRIVLVFYRGHW
jgi:cytochrome oxidase Cu insertion factor (SCO1/SenC/PrrC family)